MNLRTCFLVATLSVFAAPAVSHAELIDFDNPSSGGTKIDSNLLSGKWAGNPDQCKIGPNRSGEAVGCNYALIHTHSNPTSHVIAELCYAEDSVEEQGRFKVIKIIDEDTISVKPGTGWFGPGETAPIYKRCPKE